MQERQVTVEGETFPLPSPFHVLATANPIEYEGTYPLPEAQLDRFLLRVSFGYPLRDEEYDVLTRRLARQQEEVALEQVTDERRRAGDAGRGRDGHRRGDASAATASTWPWRPATIPTCSPAPRRVGRSAWSSRPGPGPWSAVVTT